MWILMRKLLSIRADSPAKDKGTHWKLHIRWPDTIEFCKTVQIVLVLPHEKRNNVQGLETLRCCVTVLLSSCSCAQVTPAKRREASGPHSYLPHSFSSECDWFCIIFSTLDGCLSFMGCKKHIQERWGDVQAKVLLRNIPPLCACTCQISCFSLANILWMISS